MEEGTGTAATGSPGSGGATPGTTGYRGFLFCDLRGYTRFVERHGDQAAAELLDRYRRIVRDAVARYDGAEIRTEGDSFYVVFPSASRAVLCGLTIVASARAVAADDPARAVPVAVGVHAGEAVERPDGFVGQAVNIAARVCAQAHAGEVVVTDTVRSLTRTTIAARFEPVGRRQLKGIDEPIFLFAAVGPDTPARRFGARPALTAAGGRLVSIAAIAVAAVAVAVVAFALTGGLSSRQEEPPASGSAGAAPPVPTVGQIAFTDTRTATAWLIGEDGSDRRRVETTGAVTSAQISLDGRQMVYAWTDPGGGRGRIEITRLGAEPPVLVTDDPQFDDRSPSWSPSHLAIVFARSSAAGQPAGLWAVNFDGTQAAQLTSPDSESHDLPSWSPDDTRIAFTVAGSGIAAVGTDCTGYRLMGGISPEDSGPAWSPDASRIAFTGLADSDSASDVVVMNAAGRDPINITNHPATDRDPAWSPDGQRIAFVSNRTGDDEIWIANADGSAPSQLTDRTGHAFGRLSWSFPPADAPDASGPPGADQGLVPPAVNRPIGKGCPAAVP